MIWVPSGDGSAHSGLAPAATVNRRAGGLTSAQLAGAGGLQQRLDGPGRVTAASAASSPSAAVTHAPMTRNAVPGRLLLGVSAGRTVALAGCHRALNLGGDPRRAPTERIQGLCRSERAFRVDAQGTCA
jgi:hypothetical protein